MTSLHETENPAGYRRATEEATALPKRIRQFAAAVTADDA